MDVWFKRWSLILVVVTNIHFTTAYGSGSGMDNASSHPSKQRLRSENGAIFIIYIPPNATPLIQPKAQKVIRLTKLHCRKCLLSSALSTNPENIFEALKWITLREAVLNLHMAWNQQIIQKCWNNLFCINAQDEDDVSLSVIREQLGDSADVLVSAPLDVLD